MLRDKNEMFLKRVNLKVIRKIGRIRKNVFIQTFDLFTDNAASVYVSNSLQIQCIIKLCVEHKLFGGRCSTKSSNKLDDLYIYGLSKTLLLATYAGGIGQIVIKGQGQNNDNNHYGKDQYLS